jgi:hypothetical protein
VYVHAVFIAVVAGTTGLLALGAGLHFARSMLRLIYPELLDRPHVLPTRYQAFWDRECLTPGGKEARARFYVFTLIGLGALIVAGGMALQIRRTEALPPALQAVPAKAGPAICSDCDLPPVPTDID